MKNNSSRRAVLYVLALVGALAGCNGERRQQEHWREEYGKGQALLAQIGRLKPGMTQLEAAQAMGPLWHITCEAGGSALPGSTKESVVPLAAHQELRLVWRIEDVTNYPAGQTFDSWWQTQKVYQGSFLLDTNRHMLMQKIYVTHRVETLP